MPYLKMLWQLDTPTPYAQSWDYWTSISKIIISDETSPNANWVTKKNNKIAYYGVFHSQNASSTTYGYIVLSPDSSGAASSYKNSTVYNSGTIVDVNNITWYYTYRTNGLTFSSAPDYCLNAREEDGINQIAQDLLDRIYAVPFHEDYQIGQTYTLYATDQKKTLRKAYSTYLHRNINKYASSIKYRALSDNADTIINTLINTVQSYSAPGSIIDISVFEYGVYISHGTTSSWGYDATQIDNASLESQSTSNNYKLYEFSIPDPSWPGSVYPDWETFAEIDSSGQITYNTWNGYDTQIDSIDFYVGVEASYNVTITLTNIGIDL